ncbi:MAG: hypothetical protein AAF945_00705 [Actinomycetota bacterium]
MNTTTSTTSNLDIAADSASATSRARRSARIDRRSTMRLAVALGVVGAVGFGAQTMADDEEAPPPAPPGQNVLSEGAPPVLPEGEGDQLIITGASTYDETILTKFIPGREFTAFQGDGASEDKVRANQQCIGPDPASGGTATALYTGVELPDGARIKQVRFFGEDDDATEDIDITLYRQYTEIPFFLGGTGTPDRDAVTVTSFSTSGTSSGDAVVVDSDDNLNEIAGSTAAGGGIALTGIEHRFHSLLVALDNSAGVNHLLCGVEISYQVPVSAAQGDEFHAIEPMRVFDSRIGTFPNSGLLGPNETKVIDVTDGYDLNGVAIPAQANAVPSNATAITYNIGVAGTTGRNFVAVTAGDATEFGTSAINFNGGQVLSNSATVTVAADQTIKVWGGNDVGSAHVIFDVTGYYAPPVPSNMGN